MQVSKVMLTCMLVIHYCTATALCDADHIQVTIPLTGTFKNHITTTPSLLNHTSTRVAYCLPHHHSHLTGYGPISWAIKMVMLSYCQLQSHKWCSSRQDQIFKNILLNKVIAVCYDIIIYTIWL